MKIRYIIIVPLLFMAACGAAKSTYGDDVPTNAPPTVSSVAPATGPAGTVITILGFGFSDVAPNNVVIIGDSAVSASAYDLVNPPTATEVESLTATVPNGIAAGDASVVVLVGDNASNSDVAFTVTP